MLWLIFAILLLLQVWRGYRSGLARQACELLAIPAAWLAGFFVGPHLTPILGTLNLPKPLLPVIGGAAAGLLTYLLITLTAAALFKKTSQQNFPPLRLIFGLGGAAIGLLIGLLFLWLGTGGVHLAGTFLEPTPTSRLPRWAPPVIQARRQLEQLPLLQNLNPVPDAVRVTTEKMGRVLADQRTAERFLQYPQVRPLARHPKVVALQHDPDLLRAAQDGNYLSLLRNPRLLAAMEDPELARLLRTLDFERALDYALAPATPPR